MYKISKKQMTIIKKIAEGYSYKQIEAEMSFAAQAAAINIYKIKKDHGFENREQIIEAYKEGLFTREQNRSLREVFAPELDNILGRY